MNSQALDRRTTPKRDSARNDSFHHPADVPSPESRRDSVFESRRDDEPSNADTARSKPSVVVPVTRSTRQPPLSSQVITPAPSGHGDDSPRNSPDQDHLDRMEVDQDGGLDDDAVAMQQRPKKRKRSSSQRRLSLVISKLDKTSSKAPQHLSQRPAEVRLKDPKEDYMFLLFHKEAHDKAYKHDLTNLLGASNKSLTTSEWLAGHREKQDCAIIKRVYDLQQRGMWSLRQPKSAPEPKHGLTHQDHLIRHVKWLQTDFREERKLKIDLAYQLSSWCAEYVHASAGQRTWLRVRAKHPPSDRMDETLDEGPELRAQVEPRPDDLEEDPIFHRELLEELPMFRLDDSVRHASRRFHVRSGSDYGNRLFPMANASKVRLPTEYDLDPDAVLDDDKPAAEELAPDESTCALFDPANKTLRARVNVQWPFKPPSKFNACCLQRPPLTSSIGGPNAATPPQFFYENRSPSQWTTEDDAQLRGYVKDFPSNWDLISDRMAPRTKFPSARDRRTPWECFERLINMEGPPQDPSSKPYVRYFMSRLEQARTRFNNNQVAIQQAQQTPNMSQPQMQQRFPTPLRVERRASNRRFLGLLDGARKLARRRENAAVKQQQQQAATEAATQIAQPKPPRPHAPSTPAQMSKVKYEQQLALQKRHEAQRQQYKAMQAQQQQAARQQSGNQPLSMGISQRIGNGGVPTANGHLAVPGQGQNRAMSQQQVGSLNVPNGARPNSQLAQMAAARPQGNPQLNAQGSQQLIPSLGTDQNMHQLLAQQGRMLQQTQQQGSMQRNSPNMTNGMPNVNNQAMIGSFNNSNSNMGQMNGAMPSPSLPPNTSGSSNQSPNTTQAQMRTSNASQQHRRTTSQGQTLQLSNGTIPQIYTNVAEQIRRTNPGVTQEDALLMAKNQLMQQSRQNALNAASGVHSNISSTSQTPNQMQMPPPGPGSPYQQQASMQPNFAGANGSMISSNGSSMQPRSGSPINAQMQTQQYQQHLRQQMYQQQMGQPMGSPSTLLSSPALSSVPLNGMGFNNGQRNPAANLSQNQAMRPPSRSASSMGMSLSNGGQYDQPRPGSSAQMSTPQMSTPQLATAQMANSQMSTPRLASQSPRPMSAQGGQQ